MMIMVDTSVWVDYFNGTQTPQTDILHAMLGQQIIVIGDLIYTEVLQGFNSDKDFNTGRQLLDTLVFREMVGREIALKSAGNYRYLRRQGITVRKTIDVIIGTYCIENNMALLHADKDFDALETHLGLQVVR
ncbi:MAG: VapC toxin family PIN domain ribonuclease [Candidatus Brocadia sp. WS118]|nr:MAG: VapC toxin family PIN domain ribonuclease [Candidatus Brocadia sp. WS118]